MRYRGMAMEITKQEKMALLLEQLQLPNEHIETYFKGSKLEKLTVFKQERKWHFQITVNNILPIDIFKQFIHKLKSTFQNIAHIDYTLDTEEKQDEEKHLIEYWHYYLQTVANVAPPFQELVHSQTPTVKNKSLLLTARNETEAIALKNRLETD